MTEVEKGSGNVYVDVGYPEAKTMLAKAEMVSSIIRVIEVKGLSLVDAARLAGVPQVELGKLLIGHFQAHSLIELEEMQKKIQECTNR
jgi:predicted XRE-type DNA-binding protein